MARDPNGDLTGDPAANPLFNYGGNTGQKWVDDPGSFTWSPEAGGQTVQNGHLEQGPNGAQIEQQRQQGLGAAWANMAPIESNYGQANGYMNMGIDSRNQQLSALALQQQAAQGNAPSAAANMMAQGNSTAMRNQLAMAANARGAGAMGVAGFQAANNMGQLQSQNIANTGTLRAQEMAQARDAYMQGATGMRGQDYGAANMTGNWAQNNAALAMQQRQLGLQGQLGFEGLSQNTGLAQLQAQEQQAALEQQKWATQSGLDQHSQDNINNAEAAAASASGTLLTGGGKPPGGTSDYRMKQNIGLITSDEQTKTAVHAAGVEQGRREATARWARFAPDVPHSAVGPLKITNAAGLVVPSNEFSEARHGLAFQGGAPMRVQPTTAAGVPLPSLAQAVYPGRGPEAQVRPSPAPDWDAPVHLGTPEAPPSGAEMHPSLAAAADPRVAAVTSDERMKTNTSQDGRGNALDETFRGMPAYQFAYKDGTPGEIPGIPRAGIMAQDAERTPFGAALVQDGPDGIKRIDSNAATSLTLAASSDHNARIRKLEEILGRGGR